MFVLSPLPSPSTLAASKLTNASVVITKLVMLSGVQMAKNVPGMDVRTMWITAAISTSLILLSSRQEIAAPAAVVTYTPSIKVLIAASSDQLLPRCLRASLCIYQALRAKNLFLKSMFSIFAFLTRSNAPCVKI